MSPSGYRHWHADLRPDDTPLEAGLAFTCKMKSSIPFQGRDRLERQKEAGLQRRIVCFTIDESVKTIKSLTTRLLRCKSFASIYH